MYSKHRCVVNIGIEVALPQTPSVPSSALFKIEVLPQTQCSILTFLFFPKPPACPPESTSLQEHWWACWGVGEELQFGEELKNHFVMFSKMCHLLSKRYAKKHRIFNKMNNFSNWTSDWPVLKNTHFENKKCSHFSFGKRIRMFIKSIHVLQ